MARWLLCSAEADRTRIISVRSVVFTLRVRLFQSTAAAYRPPDKAGVKANR
jgi:hypothetical protein